MARGKSAEETSCTISRGTDPSRIQPASSNVRTHSVPPEAKPVKDVSFLLPAGQLALRGMHVAS